MFNGRLFSGIYTALITPFKSDGSLDEAAFRNHVAWQIDSGIHGLVPVGTTGESPTLTHDEHQKLVEWCVEVSAGRVPILAGTGSNSTREAIALTLHAQDAGADGALLATPYYNKPTPEGVFQHVKAIHDAVSIPLVLYNIPGRSVIDLSDDLITRIANELPRVAGVKDATGNLARVSTLRQRLQDRFIQTSGEDMTTLAFYAQGGHGCISVTSNIMPRECVAVFEDFMANKNSDALQQHDKMIGLHDALFMESSPSPAKYCASLMGICDSRVRLPLVEPTDTTKQVLKKELETLSLI